MSTNVSSVRNWNGGVNVETLEAVIYRYNSWTSLGQIRPFIQALKKSLPPIGLGWAQAFKAISQKPKPKQAWVWGSARHLGFGLI
jgi:hypothetical protein